MLKQIEGDLLEIKEGVILHQVNCCGVTGGLAGALKRKYPRAFNRYTEMCRDATQPEELLGCFCIARATTDNRELLWICHLFGQLNPGHNTDLHAVEESLYALAAQIGEACHPWSFAEVHAPYMLGCGLGGGDWTDYSALIEKHLPQCIIVKLPS